MYNISTPDEAFEWFRIKCAPDSSFHVVVHASCICFEISRACSALLCISCIGTY